MPSQVSPRAELPIRPAPRWWVKAIVVFALLVTLAIAVVGPYVFWAYYGRETGVDRFWFRNGLAIVVGGALVLALVPRLGPSRWVGVTVALPVVHAIAMALAWAGWSTLRPPPDGYRASSLIEAMPIGTTVQLTGLVLIVTSWLIARGRRGEWGHALVMLALSGLLLLGLWLPIASALWCVARDVPRGWHVSRGLIALVVVPPWLAAAGFTAIAVRRAAWLAAHRNRIWCGLAIVLVVAVLCRVSPSEKLLIVFSNFVHVVLALGFLALVAIASLAVGLAARGHRGASVLRHDPTLSGEVVGVDGDPDPVVARVELTSWLRGPRISLRRLWLRTDGGLVLIPGGAWASPLSPTSMQLRTGDARAIVGVGDWVTVAGMVRLDGAQPFRGVATWGPGPGELWVGTRPAHRRPLYAVLDHLVLALWRPCAAYLVILVAVAAPALIAAR